jgi:hypothetical protein
VAAIPASGSRSWTVRSAGGPFTNALGIDACCASVQMLAFLPAWQGNRRRLGLSDATRRGSANTAAGSSSPYALMPALAAPGAGLRYTACACQRSQATGLLPLVDEAETKRASSTGVASQTSGWGDEHGGR